jgi:hypothetical protein
MKKKNKHYQIIVLNEDFGNNVKGTVMRAESVLAARLIDRNVATVYNGELKEDAKVSEIEKEIKEVKPKQKKNK